MENKEIFKMTINNDNENNNYIENGKILYNMFIGSIPQFIDIIIDNITKLNIKEDDDSLFDITIDIQEYVTIIQSKISIIQYYLNQLEYNIDIRVKENYPNTKIIFKQVDKYIIQDLQDVKFLIFCEYHKNLGHA